jgi:chromosome segregation ATPase
MTVDALSKDLQEMKKELWKVSRDIIAGREELKEVTKLCEFGRAELKNIQTLKDPLVANYDMRIEKKKKELVILESDIKAAQLTREDIDEAMAERLAVGKQAIDNAQMVERSIQVSIKNLKDEEWSVMQATKNAKLEQARESSALTLLQESVVSCKQEEKELTALIAEKQKTRAEQELIEKKEKELNKGRDDLLKWEKDVMAHEHDLKILEARIAPQYIKAFGHIKSRFINENSYTKRKTV